MDTSWKLWASTVLLCFSWSATGLYKMNRTGSGKKSRTPSLLELSTAIIRVTILQLTVYRSVKGLLYVKATRQKYHLGRISNNSMSVLFFSSTKLWVFCSTSSSKWSVYNRATSSIRSGFLVEEQQQLLSNLDDLSLSPSLSSPFPSGTSNFVPPPPSLLLLPVHLPLASLSPSLSSLPLYHLSLRPPSAPPPSPTISPSPSLSTFLSPPSPLLPLALSPLPLLLASLSSPSNPPLPYHPPFIPTFR